MNTDDEERIDRDAWRRRLGDAGAPPPTTDFVIRTQARRVVAPRTSIWWLPASLAAAVVLAVLIAQLQVEDERMHPLIDESQIVRQQPVPAPVMELPAPESGLAAESAAGADAATGAETRAAPEGDSLALPAPLAREALDEALAREALDEALARESAAESLPESKTDNAARAPAAAPAPSGRLATSPELGEIAVTGSRTAKQEAGAARRDPEEWYAQIEALRADGQDAEAEAELQKLEAAYPGWLQKRQEAGP